MTWTVVVALILFCLWFISGITGREEFPFSPYPMYSSSFIPKDDYSYLKIKAIKADGSAEDFKNAQWRIFFSEQPLLESIQRNLRYGKEPQKLLQSIFQNYVDRKKYYKIESENYVGLALYKIKYSWQDYKNKILNGEIHKFSELAHAEEVARYQAQ